MSDFSTRARSLVEHIELNPSDPGLEEELDARGAYLGNVDCREISAERPSSCR